MTRTGKITVLIVYVCFVSIAMMPNSAFAQNGACCRPSDPCTDGTVGACDLIGGEYMGDGTACLGDTDVDGRDDVCPCVDPPLPGCGDCNNNGVTDSDDLANPGACTVPLDCGDCKVTFLPDGCETIPGTCTNVQLGGSWSDPTLWDLGGDYPDNIAHVAGVFVTIPPGTSVTLDTTVEVEGLDVGPGALLSMSSAAGGDLVIRDDAAGGLRLSGRIEISEDRQILIPGGTFLVTTTGKYSIAADAQKLVFARVAARRIILQETLCGVTEQFTLTDNMTAVTSSEFVMDGTEALVCPPPGAKNAEALLGGKTAPILRINPKESQNKALESEASPETAFNALEIGGDLQMLHMAEVCIGCDRDPNATFPNVRLGGNFDNRSQFPSLFDWSGGKLTLTASAQTHVFEVGGLDLGPIAGGFESSTPTSADDRPHKNFSMNTIEVEGGGTVRFEDAIVNTSVIDSEALYVDSLILQPGSTVILGDSNIYYCTLLNQGGVVQEDGLGRLIQAQCDPTIPTVSQWGVTAMALLILICGTVVTRNRVQAA